LTFIIKYVYPPAWIGGIGVLALLLFLAPEHFLSRNGDPLPLWIDNLVVAVWIVGSILIVATTVPLKRVFLDGNRLVVSNFRRDTRIPLADITTVTQNRWIKIRPVSITFRNRTPFGRKIQFMPPQRIRWRFWEEDPVVDELRALSVPQESSPPHRKFSFTTPARTPDSHPG
jgi:hypothetical protein